MHKSCFVLGKGNRSTLQFQDYDTLTFIFSRGGALKANTATQHNFWIPKWETSWTIFSLNIQTWVFQVRQCNRIFQTAIYFVVTHVLYLCSGTAQRINCKCGHPRIVYLEAITWSIEANEAKIKTQETWRIDGLRNVERHHMRNSPQLKF